MGTNVCTEICRQENTTKDEIKINVRQPELVNYQINNLADSNVLELPSEATNRHICMVQCSLKGYADRKQGKELAIRKSIGQQKTKESECPSAPESSRSNLTSYKVPPPVSPDKTNYNGDIESGMRHGKGMQTYEDGSMYTGSWFGDVPNGYGEFHETNGNIHEGQWVEGKKKGDGVYTYSESGAVITGTWNNDNARGTEILPDGSEYKGEFYKEAYHGHGSQTLADGTVYLGAFHRGQRNGHGVQKKDNETYTGYWKNNMMHGYGKYQWKEGHTYEGEYQFGKKEGYGVFSWSDGSTSKGGWMNGLQHGEVIFTSAGGEEAKGQWQCGKHVKWH